MSKNNLKKKNQLGMDAGTASSILKKNILFSLLKEVGKNICFQCKESIDNVSDLSIEHKIPWLDSITPKELFFNLENIAFSHFKCNIRAGRRIKHICPSYAQYIKGCRCEKCTLIYKERKKEHDQKYYQRRKLILK